MPAPYFQTVASKQTYANDPVMFFSMHSDVMDYIKEHLPNVSITTINSPLGDMAGNFGPVGSRKSTVSLPMAADPDIYVFQVVDEVIEEIKDRGAESVALYQLFVIPYHTDKTICVRLSFK